MQKNELWPSSHNIYIKFYISKEVTDLNINAKTIKYLQVSKEDNLRDLGSGKNFLNRTQKAWHIKLNCSSFKLKAFVLWKILFKKRQATWMLNNWNLSKILRKKDKPRTGRKHFIYIYIYIWLSSLVIREMQTKTLITYHCICTGMVQSAILIVGTAMEWMQTATSTSRTSLTVFLRINIHLLFIPGTLLLGMYPR